MRRVWRSTQSLAPQVDQTHQGGRHRFSEAKWSVAHVAARPSIDRFRSRSEDHPRYSFRRTSTVRDVATCWSAISPARSLRRPNGSTPRRDPLCRPHPQLRQAHPYADRPPRPLPSWPRLGPRSPLRVVSGTGRDMTRARSTYVEPSRGRRGRPRPDVRILPKSDAEVVRSVAVPVRVPVAGVMQRPAVGSPLPCFAEPRIVAVGRAA